jgi:prolyl 4-hydroxylase
MLDISTQWRNWSLENLERGVAPEKLIETMQANDFDSQQSTSMVLTLIEELQNRNRSNLPVNSFVAPPPCSGRGRPWSVVSSIQKPLIQVYKNVLTEDECDRLIALSQSKLKPSTTVDNETGGTMVYEHRTSQGTFFQRGEDDFIRSIDQRASDIMNLPVSNGEGLQILNYQVGGEYRPHFDYFPTEHKGSQVHIQKGGQRVATLIFYLNDVDEGGETIFPSLNLNVAPVKGNAVYFSYFTRGVVEPLTLHGGTPVIQGEKWIATKWMRESTYS